MKSWPNFVFPGTHFSFQQRKATDVNLTPTTRIHRDLSNMNPKPLIKGTRLLFKVMKVIIIIWEITRTVLEFSQIAPIQSNCIRGLRHPPPSNRVACLFVCLFCKTATPLTFPNRSERIQVVRSNRLTVKLPAQRHFRNRTWT